MTAAPFRDRPLGASIPDSEHAVSVSLPRWADVVAYEEGDAATLAKLRTGYPRFFLNAHVGALFRAAEAELASAGERAFVFPSERAAERCVVYLGMRGVSSRMQPWRGVGAVLFAESDFAEAKSFWQHTGEIVSSRRAKALLEGRGEGGEGVLARETLRGRIAKSVGAAPQDVFLFPTGMAAIAAAHAAARALHPGRRTAQLGFPYVDSLKLQEKVGGVVARLGVSDDDHARLRDLCAAEPVAAIFTELPTNPLLGSPDLERLSAVARACDAALVVDDSIGAFATHDFSARADLVAASLTKYFAGSGDVMGGALIVSPAGPLAADLRAALAARHEELLFGEDADRLEAVSRDTASRVHRVGETADGLVAFLAAHPRVARVWHPSRVDVARYEAFRRPGAAHGGLFSLEVKGGLEAAARFHDRLGVAKGPSFGMNETLACAYTLLAHYRELEWAASHGIPAGLVRVSVGLEAEGDLRRGFEEALAAV